MKSISQALIALTMILAVFAAGCEARKSVANDSREMPTAVDVTTDVVRYGPLQNSLKLMGQINPTEHGRADVTTPLQGIVISPLVKVGNFVPKGAPLAEINAVYGQTVMQVAQKTEADMMAALSAQNALEQAISSLGQARSTLASAEVTLSQTVNNLEQARSEQVNARNDFRRKTMLLKEGVFAQSDVGDAKERLEKADATYFDMKKEIVLTRRAVDIARKNVIPAEENVRIGRHNAQIAQLQVDHDREIARGALNPEGSEKTQFFIRSPIAGTVIAVNMSAGLAVSPGTILASVVDTSRLYVDLNAYAVDLGGVQVGDPMTVEADGFPEEVFKGNVSYVGKQVDPNTRTASVRCLVENHGDKLRPGIFVKATLTQDKARRCVYVPNQAILIDRDESYCIVVGRDGKYEKRKIKEGIRAENVTEVLSGLKAGERVVTQGNMLVVTE